MTFTTLVVACYIVIGVGEENGRPVLPPVGLSPERIDKILKELVHLEKNTIMPTYNTLTATYDIKGRTILVLRVIAGEIRPYETKVYQVKAKSLFTLIQFSNRLNLAQP